VREGTDAGVRNEKRKISPSHPLLSSEMGGGGEYWDDLKERASDEEISFHMLEPGVHAEFSRAKKR
jgi:hypothetical protein